MQTLEKFKSTLNVNTNTNVNTNKAVKMPEECFVTKAELAVQQESNKNLNNSEASKSFTIPAHFTNFTQHINTAANNRTTNAYKLSLADAQVQEFQISNKSDDHTGQRNLWGRIRNLILPQRFYLPHYTKANTTLFDTKEFADERADFATTIKREDLSYNDGSSYYPTQIDLKKASKEKLEELKEIRKQKLNHSWPEQGLKMKKIFSGISKFSVGKYSLSAAIKTTWGNMQSLGCVQKQIVAKNYYGATLNQGRMQPYTSTKRSHKHTFASRFVGKGISAGLKTAAIIMVAHAVDLLPINIILGGAIATTILGRAFFAYKYHQERNREELRTREQGRPACSTLGGPPPKEALENYLKFREETANAEKNLKAARLDFLKTLNDNHAKINKKGEIVSSSNEELSKETVENLQKALTIMNAMERGVAYVKQLKSAKKWLKAELQCFAQLQAFSFFQNMTGCSFALAAFAGGGAAAGGPVAAAGIIAGAFLFAGVLPRTYANFFEQMNFNNLNDGLTRNPAFTKDDVLGLASFSQMVDVNRQTFNQDTQKTGANLSNDEHLKQVLISRCSAQNYFSHQPNKPGTELDAETDNQSKAYLNDWQKYSKMPQTQEMYQKMQNVMRQKIELNIDINTSQPDSGQTTQNTAVIYKAIIEQYLKEITPQEIVFLQTQLNIDLNLSSETAKTEIFEKINTLRHEFHDTASLEKILGKNAAKQMPEIAAIILNIDEYYTAYCLQQMQTPDQLGISDDKEMQTEFKRLQNLPFLSPEQKSLMTENLVANFHQGNYADFFVADKANKFTQEFQKTLQQFKENSKALNLSKEDKFKILGKIIKNIQDQAIKNHKILPHAHIDQILSSAAGTFNLSDAAKNLLKTQIQYDRAKLIKQEIEQDLQHIKEKIGTNSGEKRNLIVLEDLLDSTKNEVLKSKNKYQKICKDENGNPIEISKLYSDANQIIQQEKINTQTAIQTYRGDVREDQTYLPNKSIHDSDLMLNQTNDVLLDILYQTGVLQDTNWQKITTAKNSEINSETNTENPKNTENNDLHESYKAAFDKSMELHAQVHDIAAIKSTWQTQYDFRIKQGKQFLKHKYTKNLYNFNKEMSKVQQKIKEFDAADKLNADTQGLRNQLQQRIKNLSLEFTKSQAQTQKDLNLLLQKENIIKQATNNSETGVLIFSAEEKELLDTKFDNEIFEKSFHDENVAAALYNEADAATYGKVYEDFLGKFSSSLPGIAFSAATVFPEYNDPQNSDEYLAANDQDKTAHYANWFALSSLYSGLETLIVWVPAAQGFARISDMDAHNAGKLKPEDYEMINDDTVIPFFAKLQAICNALNSNDNNDDDINSTIEAANKLFSDLKNNNTHQSDKSKAKNLQNLSKQSVESSSPSETSAASETSETSEISEPTSETALINNQNDKKVHFKAADEFNGIENFNVTQKLLGNNWFNGKLRMTWQLVSDGFISIKRATYDQIQVTNMLHATRSERREEMRQINQEKKDARRNYKEVFNAQVAQAL